MKQRLRLVLILAFCVATLPISSFGEAIGKWSTPLRLSSSGHASHPLITADPYGGAHAVWTEGSGEKDEMPDTIYYSQLVDGTWTPPVDIIATTSPETAIPESLEMDDQGNLVLLWKTASRLLISSAPVAETGSATSWITSVAAPVAGPGGASLQIGADGSYHVVFTRTAQELAYITSFDRGGTWSSESRVTWIEDAKHVIGEPHLAIDQANNRYVAWSRRAEATNWGPAGVWFARSTDGGASWLAAQEISSTSGHGWPELYLDSRGRLRLTWIGNLASGGRYQVVSNDFGATFGNTSVIATPDQLRGYAGRPQTVEDSSQIIHLVFGGLGNDVPDSIWYTKASGGTWLPLKNLSPDSRDSQAPAADLGLGHRIHVVWTDYAEYSIYYSGSDTGSPAQQVSPVPTRSTQVTAVAQPRTGATPSPAATATRAPALALTSQGTNGGSASSQATVMILGLAPALLLVTTVIVVSLVRRKRR